jgi:hypothetical protein
MLGFEILFQYYSMVTHIVHVEWFQVPMLKEVHAQQSR